MLGSDRLARTLSCSLASLELPMRVSYRARHIESREGTLEAHRMARASSQGRYQELANVHGYHFEPNSGYEHENQWVVVR